MSEPEMKSTEFRQIHAGLGWNGTYLASVLGVSPDTVSRWRFGYELEPIRGPVVLAMRALASGWRP
jgi:DNA-binding transcriptional regulator YiaG